MKTGVIIDWQTVMNLQRSQATRRGSGVFFGVFVRVEVCCSAEKDSRPFSELRQAREKTTNQFGPWFSVFSQQRERLGLAGAGTFFCFFDHARKPRFVSSRCVGVDDAFCSGTVELLRRETKFLLSRFDIARSCCGTNLFDLGSHRAFDDFVSGLANFVLTKSLFGTSVVWHGKPDCWLRYLGFGSTICRHSPRLSTAKFCSNVPFCQRIDHGPATHRPKARETAR